MHAPGAWQINNVSTGAPADPAVLAAAGLFLDGGAGRAWIAEAGCADDGQWTDDPLQGYWYNHATYVDHIISGVVGVAPAAWAASGAPAALRIAPLQPADASLSWWAIDALRINGRNITVAWDADGARYGRGAGLWVLVDGTLAAHANTTQTVLDVNL